MAQETLKELKYNGSKVIAEVARRDDAGRTIDTTYLTDVQFISEDEINAVFETVFGKNTATTVKKLLDARKSAYYLFYNYDGTSVDGLIKYNDTSNVTNMESMFSYCRNLTTIPELDTSNVTNMSDMFQYCRSLTAIPLLDTSKVTNMRGMFNQCENLTTIPLLDTSNVTNMYEMFDHCENLTSIPALNTSKVTSMARMFNCCYKLTSVPELDTSNVTNMEYMFQYCRSLTTIPQLNVNNVAGMSRMFSGCSNIEEIHMINIGTNLDISSCTKMTREALLEVLGNLKDVTGQTSRKLTLGSTLLNKLTDDDKLIATNKNWTLA